MYYSGARLCAVICPLDLAFSTKKPARAIDSVLQISVDFIYFYRNLQELWLFNVMPQWDSFS